MRTDCWVTIKRRARNPRRNNRAGPPPQNLPPLYPCFPDLQLGVFCGTKIVGTMPRPRKINLEKVRASLDKVCPKCGALISPAEVRRIDFERIECPVCGEQFAPTTLR